jgi:antitoxin PrlF
MDTSLAFETQSSLTDRYQTTVPEPVRRALKLRKRDKIHFSIKASGEVVLTRAEPEPEEDPALAPFLNLLARDMAQHPERIKPLDPALLRRVRALTRGVSFDLNAPLRPEDE